MAARPYKVVTRDVDGRVYRSFLTWESAAKLFEEMADCTLPKGRREFSTISDYGTVVEFKADWDAEIPEYPVEVEGKVDGDSDEGDDVTYEEFYIEPPMPSESPYPAYGGPEHQMYGDRWLYADCPGAW